MFTEDKTGYKEFSRNEAFYETGDNNSGTLVDFKEYKPTGLGSVIDDTINYWKNKLAPTPQTAAATTISPLALRSSHDGSNQIAAAINNPTALGVAPSIVPDGGTSAGANIVGPATDNTKLYVIGGIVLAAIGLGYLLKKD